MTKKKEERRDLTIENWSTDIDKQIKDSINLVWRMNPAVIDAPPIVRMTEPPMTDPVMNMLCFMMTGKSLDELEKDD